MKRQRRTTIARMLLGAIIVGLSALAVAGCNTVKGIGQDITAIGQGGQDIIDGGI